MTEDDKAGLGIALNEATLLGFEIEKRTRIAAATFAVLSLPESGPPPEDSRVQIILSPVGRARALLRNTHSSNLVGPAVPFRIDDLLQVVTSFGGQPIYGWEFIDIHSADDAFCKGETSLDWASGIGIDGLSHSISVFQESPTRTLDLCIWFDRLEIFTPSGQKLSLEEFIAGGKRWWDAFYAGDERTRGLGLYPM